MMRFAMPFLTDWPRVVDAAIAVSRPAPGAYDGAVGRARKRTREMAQITLSATPKGNGYQGTIIYSYGVSISSAETYPTIAEAISAAAIKVLEMPERLEEIDRSELTA
jgi:hypothetical protein